MNEPPNSITKRAVSRTIPIVRNQFDKHPRLKKKIVGVLRAQLGGQAPSNANYSQRIAEFYPDAIESHKMAEAVKKFKNKPLISIVLPIYNTDHGYLHDCIDSVLSQIYENWELCIADDASTDKKVRDIIQEYAKKDKRIKYIFLKDNKHISGATNEAIALATGEFIALLDHDDVLWPNALYDVVKALNGDPSIDFLYTDEDKIFNSKADHVGPFFKPDWNPDFLHSVNYITHLAVARKSIIDKVGGLRSEYNGAQDWDLFLRLARNTKNIYHIPRIAYSWRIHDLSTAKSTESKPYVVEAQKRAIEDDLRAKGVKGSLVERDKKHKDYWNVTYPVNNNPLISIVIPSKNQYKIVKRCVDSIYRLTSYKNFEIVLVDTGSSDKRVTRLYQKLKKQHANFKLVNWPEQPFSYARSCNEGAKRAKGELLVMLNNDTEVVTKNWLELMAGDAQRQEVGAVGCLLFYPDRYHIQHAGVGVGLGGVAANSFSMMALHQPMSATQSLMINTKHNVTAVTAACMMIRKKTFEKVGGFDEDFRVTYNDVDLCLRIRELGYQNLYTPQVQLVHHESISIGRPKDVKKRDTDEFKQAKELFLKKWGKYVEHDPNINSNLNKDNAFYDI
jgi:GT2 family glycosyltransferase